MAKKPMMNPMNIQKHIKDNTTDIQNFLSDLSSWSTEMKAKELAESSCDLTPVERVPLRCNLLKTAATAGYEGMPKDKGKSEEEPKKLEKKPAPREYSEWDKFDAEKACEEVDSPKNQSKKDQEAVVESEEDLIRRRAIELRLSKMANEKKDQGNQFLKNKEFAKAIESYSEGIRCDKKNAVLYANRAQAYIFLKEFDKAINDCTESIKIDGLYIKAYFRLAKARFETGKLNEAKNDLIETLKLEPSNVEAKKLLTEINLLKSLMGPNNKSISSGRPSATKVSTFPGIKTVFESAYQRDIKSALMDDDEEDFGAKGDSCEVYPKQIFPIKKPLERRSKRPLLPIHVKMIGDNNEKKMRLDYNGNEGNSTSVSNNSSSLSTPVTDPSSPQLNATSPTSLPNLFSQLKMTSIPSKPKTAAQFNSDWKKLKPYPDMCARYLKQMETDDYLIFQDSMEYSILSDILDLLVWEFLPQSWDIIGHLRGLLKVRRFSTLLMFMTEKDRANTRKLISDCPVDIREDLKSKYDV